MASRRRKSSAALLVNDGNGGMRPVQDHRFDEGAWPYSRTVDADSAADWMAHLDAVCEQRGYPVHSLSQLETEENSGSRTIHLSTAAPSPTIDVIWEKSRRGALAVKARPSDDLAPTANAMPELFAQVEERLRLATRESAYRRGWLAYDGLPWRGELWLCDQLRLGPPSQFPRSLIGPQIVLVDMEVQGIGRCGLTDSFLRTLRELKLLLSVVVGHHFQDRMQFHEQWVPETDETHHYTGCRLRQVGYVELNTSEAMPSRGAATALPLSDVERPALGRTTIRVDDQVVNVPRDLPDLWNALRALPHERAQQFLRACNAYSVAQALFPDQRTAYATFLVVACEALKPRGNRYHDANIYNVVEALLDKATAEHLRALPVKPQKVRSNHVHRGELVSSELAATVGDDKFRDPSFDEMLTLLSRVTRQCLIEWLRRGGLDRVTVPEKRTGHAPRAAAARKAKRRAS